MSGAEGQDPAGTDPIDLQLPRGATSSGTPQTSTTSVTRLFDTKSLLFFVFDRERELRSLFSWERCVFSPWELSCFSSERFGFERELSCLCERVEVFFFSRVVFL